MIFTLTEKILIGLSVTGVLGLLVLIALLRHSEKTWDDLKPEIRAAVEQIIKDNGHDPAGKKESAFVNCVVEVVPRVATKL